MESKNIRKACDLCYRKRIKCDGQRPRCSNCQSYSSECTHEAASRQKKKKNKKPTAPANCRRREQQQQVGPVRTLHQNIQLEQAIDASLLAQKHASLLVPPPPVEVGDQRLQQSILSSPLLSFSLAHAPTPSPTPSPSYSRRPRKLELPSEEIVRHAIDVYLTTFNSVLPLFHPQSLYRTVDNWYRQPSESQRSPRDPSSWAAINVTLALALCHGPGNMSPVATQAISVAECLENAQSGLADVLAGDMDLQHVQILLGLGLLFLGARLDGLRAAVVFVSTAMRLAQAMGMHRRDYYPYHYEGIAPPEAIQRRRVFWIAYILDREVAARTRQAPIQQDADMDLDLPLDDDAGLEHSSEDTDKDYLV
ncbi:Fungal specific transcription factor domain-containing [Fusarium albosuccineum]|uniref:Fungal specific transcription factor domain-containing n=1 Tax=Fusarium albosuccineum TaxID=1237068 RepID=A0A8H4LGS9_9HYPO|nr:Fungal specific transcription factor domain-containing [Fusarium albosuccineum]